TCLRVLNDTHAAEDASQAVFLIFLKKAPTFGSGVIVSAWLYRTAEFVARSQRQRAAVRSKWESAAGVRRGQWGGEDRGVLFSENAAGLWAEMRKRLDEVLMTLPATQRDAFVMRYFDGRSVEEIAREIGCPMGTASARVSRALERIRRLFSARK